MNGNFPEVGDWVTVSYARSSMCWGTVEHKGERGVVVKARASGNIQIPSQSPSRFMFFPWSAIDCIQGADRGAGE